MPVMWRLTELHVFTFFLRCFTFFWGEFRSQGSEAWQEMHWIASCGRNRSTCVQSVVRAQWVMKPCLPWTQLLEPIHQRLDHQVSPTSSCSLRLSALLVGAPKQQWPFAKGHPNPTKHVGRNRCLQQKKDRCLKTAHRQRPGTLKNTAFEKMVYSSKKKIG